MSRYVKKSVRAMSGYTPGEQPQGAAALQVIKLNTNENPYPPSAGVRDALSNSNVESLRLYPDP
ncbi:histidinol-phosphate transaminase, partial [Verrucomicrobiota bacterium]